MSHTATTIRQGTTKKRTPRRRAAWRIVVGIATTGCAAALLLSIVSQYVSPDTAAVSALLCLAFPLFFILSGIALAIGVALRHKAWVAPLIALIVSLPALRTYCPINLPHALTAEADTLRVITFNTRNFGGHESGADGRNFVAAYMLDAAADIVCFQEGATEAEFYQEHVKPLLIARYPYADILRKHGQSPMGIFSRWPIVDCETVTRSGTNLVRAYRIVRAAGDTLRVVNCHLSSIGLSEEQRELYSNAVRGYVARDDEAGGARAVVRAFLRAARRRALVADTVAQYVEKHRGESLIVCGDLNATPVSYEVRRVKGELTDCFRAAGNGIGRSFCRDAIVVRIDHMFCSDDWQPAQCRVVPVETLSDHYPLVATLVRHEP